MNVADSKPRGRQRASTPRSKTGCITCKMRRLKCGEEKPGCLRCKKSGWQCDGYDNGLSSNLIPSTRTPSPRSAVYVSSVSSNLDEEERRYFQVYVDQHTTCLDHQDTDSSYWKRIVLQECHSNPCVRHVIVAQGALAKSQVAQMSWAYFFRVNGPQDPHHEFALMQYEKALRGLRTSIGILEKGRGARTTLISSLALSVFDCFCGNGGFAAQHVRFGRKLLTSWRAASAESRTFTPESPIAAQDPIDDALTRMFLRLDINIICAMGIDNEWKYDDTLFIEGPRTSMPGQFFNFEEALRVRMILLFDGYQFFLQASKYELLPREEIPERMFTLRQYWLDQTQLWNMAFDPIVAHYTPDTTIHPLARPDSSRLRTIMMLLRITGMLHNPETAYDGMIQHFEYLVSMAEEVIEFEKIHAPVELEDIETYTFEVRIIPALYLTATKCRLSTLRRRAASLLLSSRRREGIWDSILCGKIAEWIIGLEEEFGAVEEDQRCWGEVVERDLMQKKVVVRCRQGFDKREGQWAERSTEIEW